MTTGIAMAGCWVFVCGASGAGKDSVIALARKALATRGDIVFARRLITRPAQPGSDHEPASSDEFDTLRGGGALAWHWQAHGFDYGIPQRYAHQVSWGRIVVVNGSREHVSTLCSDPLVHRVEVQAQSQRLAERLEQRGRDDPRAIAERLARNAQLDSGHCDFVICNDGVPEVAGEVLRRHLEALAGQPEPGR